MHRHLKRPLFSLCRAVGLLRQESAARLAFVARGSPMAPANRRVRATSSGLRGHMSPSRLFTHASVSWDTRLSTSAHGSGFDVKAVTVGVSLDAPLRQLLDGQRPPISKNAATASVISGVSRYQRDRFLPLHSPHFLATPRLTADAHEGEVPDCVRLGALFPDLCGWQPVGRPRIHEARWRFRQDSRVGANQSRARLVRPRNVSDMITQEGGPDADCGVVRGHGLQGQIEPTHADFSVPAPSPAFFTPLSWSGKTGSEGPTRNDSRRDHR